MNDEEIKAFTEESRATLEHMLPLFETYGALVDAQAGAKMEEARRAKSVTSMSIVAMVLAFSLIALLMAGYLSLMITRPVKELQKPAEAMAYGDLTMEPGARLLASKDEVGALARAYEAMAGNLRRIVTRVMQNADSTASMAEELSASSEEVNASTEQMSAIIQKVANGGVELSRSAHDAEQEAEQLTASVTSVARLAKESTKSANQATSAAEKGRDAAKHAGAKMNSINEAVSSSAAVVRELGSRTQQINNVIEVINGISEQTNLLALNAAIEAARAGEAGRGFTVVAGEVRKLAGESQQATKQIEAMITEIVQSTRRAVDSMESGSKEVEEGNQVISEALTFLEMISREVVAVAAQAEQIGAAAGAQLEKSEGVRKSISNVSAVAEESAAASEEASSSIQETTASMAEVATAAQGLAEGANELRQLVGQFKVDAREKSEEVREAGRPSGEERERRADQNGRR